MSIFTGIFYRKSKIENPKPGLYHYVREDEHEKSRIHLRIDPDGTGTLIVNANRVMHLNPTAALMAYLILEKVNEEQAVNVHSPNNIASNKPRRAKIFQNSEFRFQNYYVPMAPVPFTNLILIRSCRSARDRPRLIAWTWPLRIAVTTTARIVITPASATSPN